MFNANLYNLKAIKLLIAAALLAALVLASPARAQVFTLANNDTILISDPCSIGTGYIFDDGGSDGIYSNDFQGWLVISGASTTSIRLSGTYNTEPCCDQFSVWDGTTLVVDNLGGSGDIDITCHSGTLTLYYHTDGSVQYSGLNFMFTVSGASNPAGVTALSATNISSSTATLQWNSTGTGPYHVLIDGVERGVTNATSYTLTSLTPATRYVATVYAEALANDLCAYDTTAFRTACAASSLPTSEGFEGITEGAMPPCWLSLTNFDDPDAQPQVVYAPHLEGSASLMLSCGNNSTASHFGLVASQPLNSTSQAYVDFSMMASHYGTVVVIGECDTSGNEYTLHGFTPIETVTILNEGQWSNYRVAWNSSSNGRRLAFYMLQQSQGGAGRRVYIDEIGVSSCGADSLVVQHITENSVELTWVTRGNPTTTVRVFRRGALTPDQTISSATPPLTVTGLTPGTEYLFSVSPDCGLTHTITAATASPAPSANGFCSNFRSTSAAAAGWTFLTPEGGSFDPNSNRVYYSVGGNGNHGYMISPRLAGLAGMKVAVHYTSGYNDDTITLGMMTYADDSNTFTPVESLRISGYDSTLVFTIPTTATGQYFALRFDHHDYWYSVEIPSVQIASAVIGDTRIVHRRATSITVEWDTVYGASSITAEIGYRGFSPGTGSAIQHTLVPGQNRIKFTGLSPQNDYDVLLYTQGGTPCSDRRIETRTVRSDFSIPYCEDFVDVQNGDFDWWSNNWCSPRGLYDCPRISDYYADWNYYTRTLELASMGFSWDYYSTVMLPDVDIDSAGTLELGMYITDDAPQSTIEVGVMLDRYYWREETFVPIDTIYLNNPNIRQYQSVALPASELRSSGRLCLRYKHNDQYRLHLCHIDYISIAPAAFGNLTMQGIGFTDATLGIDTLIGADSVDIILVSDNDTAAYRFPAGGVNPVTITGLDSGTYYRVYLHAVPDSLGCTVYAGHFFTNAIGEGSRSCFTFGDLLSYELPTGWTFSDSAYVDDDLLVFDSLAILPLQGNMGGRRLTLRMAATDSLQVGYTTSTTSPYNFTPLFTATVDSIAVVLPNTPDTAWLALMAYDTVHLAMVGVGNGPIVDFTSESGRVICTERGSHSQDYALLVTEVGDSSFSRYYASENPYYITGLLTGHTYRISYGNEGDDSQCWPEVTVTVADSLTLPYCETFDLVSGSNGVPDIWTFYYDNDVPRQLEVGWGEIPLRFGEWGRWNQKAVLPPIKSGYATESLTLRIRAHIWSNNVFQVGTVASNGDTSTFIPLANNGDLTGWVDMIVSLDSIGNRRIALRSDDLALIDYINISTMPEIKVRLIDSRTLRLEASSNSGYWVHYYDNYGNDSIFHIDTSLYNIYVSEEYIDDVYLEFSSDSAADGCKISRWWQLSDRKTPPLCAKDEYWDWEYRCIGDTWDDYYRDRRPHIMRSNSDPNNYAYRLLPDFEVDSIKRITMAFDFSADYVGDILEVGVMSDAYDTATFVPVDTVQYTLTDGGWQHFIVSFESYTGDGRWIALRHFSGNCGTCDGLLATGRYEVTICPAAGASVALTRWNIATIDAPDTGFYVEYGPANFSAGDGTVVHVNNLPYNITLTGNTAYDFLFRCNATELGCDNRQRIMTLSEPLMVPSCTNFDTATAGTMLRSWTLYGTGAVSSDAYYSAPNSLALSVNTGTMAVTPDVDVSDIRQVAVELWFRADDQSDRLVVGTMSNPADMSTFYALRSFAPKSVGEWQHIYVSLENAPASHHFIALRARNNGTNTVPHNIYVDNLNIGTCAAFDLRIEQLDDSMLNLSWQEFGSPTITLTVDDNGTVTTYSPSGGSFSIPVTPQHSYTVTMHAQCPSTTGCSVPYDDTIHIVEPSEGNGCVNPTDLNSPNAVFLSGSYQNPYATAGAINFGSTSADSRHTVCYDTTERDPRTGGLLRTIPEGASSSVRLGNWSTGINGAEAEGVIYSLFVDTLSFNLLIMRYAAVLQDPMHAPEDQPRFRLELLDSSFNLIDPVCASADFVANRNLGWNEAADNVLWKDWTTFGVDVRAYAEQNIYVRLTTYDCNEGSHYGYAYFTLECMRDNIVTETCGAVDSNTFTAPAGFNYRWYTLPFNTTVATTRRLVSASNNTTYYCDISSTENPSCMFTISAFSGTRYPLAAFDTLLTMRDCGFHVQFNNLSAVSADGITPLASGEPCETALWDFGNGQTSRNYHGETFYNAPGTYTVTLVSSIAHGNCTDTAVMTLNLQFPTEMSIVGPDTLCYGDADSLLLVNCGTSATGWTAARTNQYFPINTTTYNLGENNYSVIATDPYGCTSTLSHHLTVNPSYHFTDTLIICTQMLPYSYADTVFGVGTTAAEYHQWTQTTEGCDSSYHLMLSVSDTNAETIHDTVVASICDNQSYLFFGTEYNTPGNHFSVHLNSEGVCDSIHNLLLEVRPTSTRDTAANPCDQFTWYGTLYAVDTNAVRIDTNSVLCDSTTTLHLTLRHSTDTVITHSIVQNSLPYLWNGISFTGDTTGYIFTISNSEDCDSTITFNLVVFPNRDTVLYSDICEGMLPLVWNGATFSIGDTIGDTITHQALLATLAGADSLVTMHLHVLWNSDTTFSDTILQNNLASFTPPLGLTASYSQSEDDSSLIMLIDTVLTITNAVGCDSTVHYSLFLYRNHHTYDTAQCCDNQLPYPYLDTTVTTTDSVATFNFQLLTINGADSLVTFTLYVHPTFEVSDTHVICPHKPFLYEGVDYGGPIDFDSPHLTVYGCDSLVHVSLMMRDTLFRLSPIVSLDSNLWQPYDSTLLGCALQDYWISDTSQSVSREWTFWPAYEPDSAIDDTVRTISGELEVGVYSFRLIAVGEEGCYDTIQRDSAIYVFPRPVAEFRSEPFNIPNHDPQIELFTLATPADSLTYCWLISTIAGSDAYDSVTEPVNGRWTYSWEPNIAEGEYEVALVAYWLHTIDSLSVTCTDTARHNVIIVNTYLEFPNVVSPNGDGINDIWGIVNLLEYREYSTNELWIYDRSGTLVYHVRNIHSAEQFWDPNATNSPDGTYYYRFGAQNAYGVVKHNGIIEVLR